MDLIMDPPGAARRNDVIEASEEGKGEGEPRRRDSVCAVTATARDGISFVFDDERAMASTRWRARPMPSFGLLRSREWLGACRWLPYASPVRI